MHLEIVLAAFGGLLLLRILLALYRAITSPLRSVPGPFWARFTKLWYFHRVQAGRFEWDNIALHKKYGKVVRTAPNEYSIDDPDAVKIIYGIASRFPKSTWYDGFGTTDPNAVTLFNDRNIKRHAETRRNAQALYAMSSVKTFELYADQCAEIFHQRLSEFAEQDKPVDMAHWFQCYAFDVVGNITYSQRYGFLDAGEDIGKIIVALRSVMKYSTLAGIYPAIHPYTYRLMSYMPNSGAAGRNYIMNFARQRIQQRRETGDPEKQDEADEDAPQDFLAKIMAAQRDNPSKVTPREVFMMGVSNIIAGADTTAISLSAILYFLLNNAETLRKLREEIAEFEGEGKCGKLDVKFEESLEMPYYQAVMKEAMRLHPATGLPMWRTVPAGGAEICGRHFPEDTVVGINTWVAHYNEDVFGPDAREFRPERWLEQDADKLKHMEQYYIPFGLGARTCMGRHIAMLEMSKLIPRLVRDFDFELEHPEQTWTTSNVWFVKPQDFEVRIRRRDRQSSSAA